MKRFKLIASGYLLLIKEGKVLLSKRKNTGYEDGNYGLPSGHLEPHETVRDCCAREAKEEIGITIKAEDLELVHMMHRRQLDERIDFFFVTSVWEGQIVNMEAEKCAELSWFAVDSLPLNTIGYIRKTIEQYQANILYSEFGW